MPTRPNSRQRRQEANRQARFKEARRRRAFTALSVVLAVSVVAALVVNWVADRRAHQRLVATLTAGDCRYDTHHDRGRDHVPNPTYQVDPPAGGNHTSQAASAGVFPPDQVPGDGPLVHALEHGFIILWYHPGIDDEDLEGLQDVADRFMDSTLVAPRESLDVPVAATAWHQRLLCDSFEEQPFVEFIRAFQDQGPEKGFI